MKRKGPRIYDQNMGTFNFRFPRHIINWLDKKYGYRGRSIAIRRLIELEMKKEKEGIK